MLSLALTLSAGARTATHFIQEDQYRAKVETAFGERIKTVGKQFFVTKGEKLTGDELEAMKFLYAYMPLADVTDYPTSFYANNVKLSFEARGEMAWGNKVPDLLFRHFVLPIRVNNEALDNSREVFFHELKNRVKGMSMYDAILEVNHWCHEKVTYQPSDARTSSPLATVRTATGRCGEQSTFTVAALRSIGIPARQVYTPRWAHTDDNHAWVEAWADGKWYFLGACEPEPVLNLGWFNAPASRAMLMHTRAFGDYNGPEEVMLRTTNFTEINLTSNYAPVAQVNIVVKDKEGRTVDNARVEYKIYNYAEFFTAVTKYTDKNGQSSLSAGIGDMLVWASKDGKYGYQKASFGKDKTLTVVLDHDAVSDSKETVARKQTIDIVPPAENAKMPEVTDEMRKENLINSHKDNEDRVMAILATLSDKDLRDITKEILEDNFTAKTDQVSPRVEDEMITIPFKNNFEKNIDAKLQKQFRDDPYQLVLWINKNIRLNPDKKALQIAQTPVGTMKAKMTDNRSRDIFFVDVARSLGIEAQKDAVTGKVQYKKDGKWTDVNFESAGQKNAATGKLVLKYTPTATLDDPKYYNHFKDGHNFDCGTYMLTTGTRLANGSVLAETTVFNIKEGETTTIDLDIRQSSSEISVLGSFDSETIITKDGKDVSILSQTGRGYYVVAILGVGQEPTNHALHDIEKMKKAFEDWGRPVVLLFESEADAHKFNKDEFANLPSTVIYGIDKDATVRNRIATAMKLQSKTQMPMFIIADTFNRVVFVSQGYTIGLGEQMSNVFNKL